MSMVGKSLGKNRNQRAGHLLRKMKHEFGDDFDPVIEAIRHSRALALSEDGKLLEPEYDDDGKCTFQPDHQLYVSVLLQAAGFVMPKLKAVEVGLNDDAKEVVLEMFGLQPKTGEEHEGVVIDATPRLAQGE